MTTVWGYQWRALLISFVMVAIAVLALSKDELEAEYSWEPSLDYSQLSAAEIEDALQVCNASDAAGIAPKIRTDDQKQCPLVHDFNQYKRATTPETSGYTALVFEKLFPSSPAFNALLATLYISGPPSQYPFPMAEIQT